MAESNIIVTRLLSKYATIDFFKKIVNIYLYPSDFNVIVGNTSQDSVTKYIDDFFTDFRKKLNQYGHDSKSTAEKFIDTAKEICKLRNGVTTYSNIDQHFQATNALVKKLMQDVKSDPIKSDEEFRTKTKEVLSDIKCYYDSQIANSGYTKIQEYIELMGRAETSPLQVVESFKDMVIHLDSSMSQMSTVVKDESSIDYYVLSDESSVDLISDSITDYLCNNYSFYHTGLEAYDKSVDGFESSSVHIIASPSNGGKSVTLSNLLYRIAKNNRDEFKENDAALYITCEDDLIKTTRKFMSIFGNNDFNEIREIYRYAHEFISKIKKSQDSVDKESRTIIKNIFCDILNESITKTTQGTLKIIFKYSPERSLSAGEIETKIKELQLQGIRIKYLIIDYLDVLKPTLLYNNNLLTDEYQTLGIITQELRTLSRVFGIPVITATQTAKSGDNIGQTLNNGMIGESYKKVKFADFIFMQRMRDDLNIFSPDVEKYVFPNSETLDSNSPKIINMKDDLLSTLKPLEMRVSKSKEKGKGYFRYMVFSSRNLRLYNTVQEYLNDLQELNSNSKIISRKTEKIKGLAQTNISYKEDICPEFISQETTDLPWIDDN